MEVTRIMAKRHIPIRIPRTYIEICEQCGAIRSCFWNGSWEKWNPSSYCVVENRERASRLIEIEKARALTANRIKVGV